MKEILPLRLYSLLISAPHHKSVKDITSHLFALQAQDYPGALWALGLRLPDSTQLDIENAIINKELVRTWPMRGTLHFIEPHDAKWMLELSTPRLLGGVQKRRNYLGLTEKILEDSRDIIIKALKGNKSLTRDAMVQTLIDAGIPMKTQWGYHILWWISQTGTTIFGPNQGKQQTIVLLDEWISHSKTYSTREEALAEYARRYFIGHGPATVNDLARWSGQNVTDMKKATENASTHLKSLKIDNKTYWMDKDLPEKIDATEAVFLLPGFDEYMLGYQDRSMIISNEDFEKVVPGKNGMFKPTIVSNGEIIGTWSKTVKKKEIVIDLQPFRPVTKKEKELIEIPAKRYGEFMGLPTKIN